MTNKTDHVPLTPNVTTVNIEEAAAESDQDRRDHRALTGEVAQLLRHEDAMRVPSAVRRLDDGGIEPLVVAKTLAIRDRDGGLWFRLSTRAAAFALASQEGTAVNWVSIAIRDVHPDTAADVMASGATWIATQYGLDRELLVRLVTSAPRRAARLDRGGYGVVDFVDHHGIGDRASIATAIRNCQLPMYAPLAGAPFEVPK